eukprot:1180260-Prorocentrum_minimum.AAC.2
MTPFGEGGGGGGGGGAEGSANGGGGGGGGRADQGSGGGICQVYAPSLRTIGPRARYMPPRSARLAPRQVYAPSSHTIGPRLVRRAAEERAAGRDQDGARQLAQMRRQLDGMMGAAAAAEERAAAAERQLARQAAEAAERQLATEGLIGRLEEEMRCQRAAAQAEAAALREEKGWAEAALRDHRAGRAPRGR